MNFQSLVASIHNTNRYLQQQSIKAVNIHITLRNWLVGFYIVEFEQKGEDRASYGSQLLHNLAAILQIKGLTLSYLGVGNFIIHILSLVYFYQLGFLMFLL